MNNEIVIFSYKIARDLIQKNYRLIDIRPNKKVNSATVFVFYQTESLRNYLKQNYNIAI